MVGQAPTALYFRKVKVEEMNNYSVYKHTCPNGKVYIGITKQKPCDRWKNGLGYQSSPHFYNAICKYGWDNIGHEILAQGLTKNEACEAEKFYIAIWQSCDTKYGYNQTLGGDEGLKVTPEIRSKISSRLKDYYKNNPQKCDEISKRMLGIIRSEESRHKMSIAKKGLYIPRTSEWNKHISEAQKGKHKSPELAEKLRNMGMANAKPIFQMTLNGEILRTFESSRQAERETGVRCGNISKVCNGFSKTAGGYIWRYADENINAEKH